MPHFYFDVCTNGVIDEDEDGIDLLNAATARLIPTAFCSDSLAIPLSMLS